MKCKCGHERINHTAFSGCIGKDNFNSKYCGCEHFDEDKQEIYISAEDALEDIKELVNNSNEPVGEILVAIRDILNELKAGVLKQLVSKKYD